jgi:hypothetical protein
MGVDHASLQAVAGRLVDAMGQSSVDLDEIHDSRR